MKPHSAGKVATKAGLQDRQAALLDEVDREPGQEEISQRVDAVLAEIDAEHHAVGKQLADMVPSGAGLWRALLLGSVEVDQRATGPDVVEFGLVDAGVLFRPVDGLDPDQAHDDSERAHHEEYVAPAVVVRDPAHQGCEDHGCEILPGIEERRRGAALIARKPGRNDAGVGGERRRFGDTDEEA
ncbi:hypothetical protein ACVWXL_004489 [Bradyrhizobium sp. GM22.5]